MKKESYTVSKKYVLYVKKDLVLKITHIKRLGITVITLKSIEELLMIFVI